MLFNSFLGLADAKDPRHQSYIVYFYRIMLESLFHKGIARLDSMKPMTYEFNDVRFMKNGWLSLTILGHIWGAEKLMKVACNVITTEYVGRED